MEKRLSILRSILIKSALLLYNADEDHIKRILIANLWRGTSLIDGARLTYPYFYKLLETNKSGEPDINFKWQFIDSLGSEASTNIYYLSQNYHMLAISDTESAIEVFKMDLDKIAKEWRIGM